MKFDVESNFSRRSDVVHEIYETLVSAAGKIDPVVDDPKKTSIHLNRKRLLPEFRNAGPILVKGQIVDESLDSERIFKTE